MDDEEMVRHVAGELLRALGHEADFADGRRGGDRALRGGAGGGPALRRGHPRPDHPRRHGRRGDRCAGCWQIDPGVKAVVSSGYSDDDVVANYREHGFRAFLKKPYNLEELSRALDDARA